MGSGFDCEAQPSAASGGAVRAGNYQERPWTAAYPPTLPRDIAVGASETMLSLLQHACAEHADRVAFELDGECITFGEWLQRADALARWFVHAWKLEQGDRVLLFMPNLPAYPVALLAGWIAGLALMPVYCAATAQELEGPIAAIAPKAVVGLDVLMDTFRAARGAERMRELVVSAPPEYFGVAGELPPQATHLDEAVATGRALPPVGRTVTPHDLALMSYTGGTTGVSKAVRTTHSNMRAGIEILRLVMADHTCGAGGLVASVHPFSHAAGMSVNLLQYASRGVTQLLFPKMIDAERLIAQWHGRAINSILAGPAFFNRLMATPGFAELDFSSLRSGLVGGMPLRADIRDRWEALTGKPLLQGYGLTETSVPIAGELGFERHRGSVGFPFPSVEMTLRDPDDPELREVAPGAIGEVWLRGPFLMDGYHGRPDETARAMTADGWFRTGDLGRMEAGGALYLLGRIKDMLLVDGANVYPGAIEEAVGAHPGIADVCAVGMPDEEDGERVRLFVVRRDPALDEAAVAAWCAQRLSHFKQPKRIEFLDALPRSAVDKVLRRELAERPLD